MVLDKGEFAITKNKLIVLVRVSKKLLRNNIYNLSEDFISNF